MRDLVAIREGDSQPLAALGFTGAAFAGDATTEAWSTTSTPATSSAPTVMSDRDMDKVTAGSLSVWGGSEAGQGQGQGVFPTLPTLPDAAHNGFRGKDLGITAQTTKGFNITTGSSVSCLAVGRFG
jgi:hypothetical protein